MRKILLLSLIILFMLSGITAQEYSRIKVNVPKNEFNKLVLKGVSGDACYYDNQGALIAELSAYEIQIIKDLGYEVEYLIEDVTAFYKNRNKKYLNAVKSGAYPTILSQTPENFSLGSLAGFYSYEEAIAQLDSMSQKFPNLVTQKESLGETLEGREIYMVKISDNPNQDEGEPEILYTGLHHAREPMSMQVLFYYLYSILENYGTDEEATALINNLEIYFVPVVSADGYAYNEAQDPDGGGMWRKNRRDNGDGTWGVDINRNYGFNWGYDDQGSSPDGNIDSYRGSAPFSEPATQAMRDFVLSRHFVMALNNHTYSNLIVYPWGYEPDHFTPDSMVFRTYSAEMSAENHFLCGTPSQTVGYTGNGDANDWMYGEQTTKEKIISFTPEIGAASDGFWPEVNRIEQLCADNYHMHHTFAKLALRYAKLQDNTPLYIENPNYSFSFDFTNLGLDTPAAYTVNLIPVSSNILSVGNAFDFTGMQLLEMQNGQVQLTLNPNIQTGDEIVFVVEVDNGYYAEKDTIVKVYGVPDVLLTDSINSMDNWVSDDWNITSEEAHSGTYSITDSPEDYYSWMQNNDITSANSFDLTDASAAYVTYYAMWDIESQADFVQFMISDDNGTTWTPLEGTSTVVGVQNNGLPVYEGSVPQWTLETVNISDYVGSEVYFRFNIQTDFSFMTQNDGFYFDDFTVMSIPASTSYDNIIDNRSINVYPNPAEDYIYVESVDSDFKIELVNSLGEVISTKIIKGNTKNKIYFNTKESGIYYIKLYNNLGEFISVRKIIRI